MVPVDLTSLNNHGKRFNRWLRMAANRGINVGTASQAAQTFTSGRAAAGKKIGTPAKAVLKAQASGIKDANTLQNIAKASDPLKAAFMVLTRQPLLREPLLVVLILP